MDVCEHIGAGKLKGLAPVIESSGEQVEALEESPLEEIAINFVTSEESMNKTTANVDIDFAKKIATIIDLDPESASLAEYKKNIRMERLEEGKRN